MATHSVLRVAGAESLQVAEALPLAERLAQCFRRQALRNRQRALPQRSLRACLAGQLCAAARKLVTQHLHLMRLHLLQAIHTYAHTHTHAHTRGAWHV